jgi:endonuclease IV
VRLTAAAVHPADLLPTDLPIGGHQSIAGGTPRAVERGIEAGCRVVQIFVKNNNRWVGKTIDDVEAREFRRAVRRAAFAHVAAHTSYLINLASPSPELRRQSVAALADEILRCQALGIRDLILQLVSPEGYSETLLAFERTVGVQNLAAIHVNDSKRPRGSRVDRHEHIGRGSIGPTGFRNLMTDPRLAAIPKFLETPKDETLDHDRRNLATLRRLSR